MNYPRSVFFILGNEFCERFSFYGMSAILTMYLRTEHHFQEHIATFIYHTFVCIAYASPIPGSILADSYFGRYRVILYVSLFYVFGHVILSTGSIPTLGSAVRLCLDFGGLLVIALCTGGIKPCVSAFAADQFDESQATQRAQFFSYFYFSINAGSLLATIITPILRARVQCFGSDQCFPLAFGVPRLLMLVAFLVFFGGTRYYKNTKSTKSRLVQDVAGCIGTALRRKKDALLKKQKSEQDHWLDYAAPDYSQAFIASVKTIISISLLYSPLILFSALYDQTGSTWIYLMGRLDGRVGPISILPDQMNFVNSLLVLILVPLFELVVYPCFRKIVHVTQLRKMVLGGLFAALSFVVAGMIQLQAAQTQETLPQPGYVFVQQLDEFDRKIELSSLDSDFKATMNNSRIEVPIGEYRIFVNSTAIRSENLTQSAHLDINVGQGYGLTVFESPNGSKFSLIPWTTEKVVGTSLILVIESESRLDGEAIFVLDSSSEVVNQATIHNGESINIEPSFISDNQYTIKWGTNCSENWQDCEFERPFTTTSGSTHALILMNNGSNVVQLVRDNSVNILWMLIPIILLTIGEVLLWVTALEFSYSEASKDMKSIVQAIWLMTAFLGNFIDIIISGSHIVADPAIEFFVYAALMTVVIGIFIILSMNYTYVKDRQITADDATSQKRGIAIADKDL